MSASAATDSATPSRSEQTRVLLLEDDRDLARALRTLLRRLGCSVVHAERISQARRRLQEGKFDIAVLDIELPDGSGLDFVLHLRSLAEPCAALVLTGSVEPRHLREAVGLGVTEYLLKPVDADTLATALDRVIEQSCHMRAWVQKHPAASRVAEFQQVTPVGLGKRPVDLVRQIAIEFELTERETDALEMVAEGHRDREIAQKLDVSYSRIRQLLSKGFGRLGLRSRNDFIRFLCERTMS